ncbi:hypothetical protein NPIL_31041 [Nephila pilipes]|uniref:Uncharacterized protein n=1 Tax=Nephila pilipes TaxID=299642 RepID=A0A8X6M920_NEPPI|nr:hypothetical protein NPIL_31041 [Nephila pilipes]
MAERETGNALDCDKIFVKRTLQREKHILSSLLTEVFVSLDEIEKILLETDPWEKNEEIWNRLQLEREYLARTLNRERKVVLSCLTSIQWSLDHLNDCLGETGIVTPEVILVNGNER